MAEFFDTNIQFLNDSGALLNGGRVFFAKPNTNPTVEINQITIYNDRELTIELPNPIDIGSDGRTSVNGVYAKVWIGERYSFELQDKNNINILAVADQGENPSVGAIIALSNVLGSNAITAEGSPSITEYVDKQDFVFTIASENTDVVTLNIDSLSAKSIRLNFREELTVAFFQPFQVVQVVYNLAEDYFQWVDTGRSTSNLTDVAGDGNTITADGGPSVGSYIDKHLYAFTPNNTNTGAATLNIESIGAITIKNKGVDMSAGQLLTGILHVVAYNSTSNIFELVSGLPLSSPGPIGETNGNTIKATDINASGFIQTDSGAKITTLGDTGTLDGSDVKVPTNLTVQEAIAAATANPGKVLQIVSVTKKDAQSSTPGVSTFVAVSGLSLSITPISTSNKVRISGFVNVANAIVDRSVAVRLLNNGTPIGNGDAAGSRLVCHTSGVTSLAGAPCAVPFDFTDEPSTTSPITYSISVAPLISTLVLVNRGTTDSNSSANLRTISVITAEEIRG